jgi:acyl-CoA thioester hydrolase
MTRISSHGPYDMALTVKASDIDPLGHVNNVVYVQWVQDVAVAHWLASATTAQREQLLWVVAKHQIEYKRPATIGEQIIVRTWVGKATHRLFTRHTRILRKHDDKTLAEALTWWAPVDRQTRQHVKPDAQVYAMFSTDSDGSSDARQN